MAVVAVAHQVTPLASCCAFQGHYHKQGVHHGRERSALLVVESNVVWGPWISRCESIPMPSMALTSCGQGRHGSHLSLGRPRCPPSQHYLSFATGEPRGEAISGIFRRIFWAASLCKKFEDDLRSSWRESKRCGMQHGKMPMVLIPATLNGEQGRFLIWFGDVLMF